MSVRFLCATNYLQCHVRKFMPLTKCRAPLLYSSSVKNSAAIPSLGRNLCEGPSKGTEKCFPGLEKDMENMTSILQPEKKKIIAYHEAGCSVVWWFLQHADEHINPLPRGSHLYFKKKLFDQTCMTLGGSISEQIFFGKITTDSLENLQKVIGRAFAEIVNSGTRTNFISALPGKVAFKEHFEKRAQDIGSEARFMVSVAYNTIEKLLLEHKADVEKVALRLLEKEVLCRGDLIELLGAVSFPKKSGYEEFLKA